MESDLENTRKSTGSTFRQRKSIFSSVKPKQDKDDPTINETANQIRKVNTTPTFYPTNFSQFEPSPPIYSQVPSYNRSSQLYYPQQALNRTSSSQMFPQQCQPTICIRPVSVNKYSKVFNPAARPASNYVSSNINSAIFVQNPPNIVISPPVQLSQTVHIRQPVHFNQPIHFQSQIPRKRVAFQDHTNIQRVYTTPKRSANNSPRISPVKIVRQEIISQIRPEVSRVIIRQPVQVSRVIIRQNTPQITKIIVKDDPNTISEMNKLSSLNQYLSHQYDLVNDQLFIIKSKTSKRQFVEDKVFLERSFNTIDDIFLSQTTQALHRLDQISRYQAIQTILKKSKKTFMSSTCGHKQTSRSPHSPIKDMQMLKCSGLHC